jgi:hypothetical protein
MQNHDGNTNANGIFTRKMATSHRRDATEKGMRLQSRQDAYNCIINALNKILGRTMMWTAEDCQQLAREQYGSRKLHRAIDQGCNKRLSTDLILILRWPGVICSNDAKSCYDRIVHAIAALSMLRQRVAKSAIICVLTTLQNLSHTIHTAYGNSADTYGGSL